jgi:hypothetical protein
MRAVTRISRICVVGVAVLLCATAAKTRRAAAGNGGAAKHADIDKGIVSLGTNIYPGDHLNIAEAERCALGSARGSFT